MDVKGGGIYTKAEVDSLLASNDDEQLIWDTLATTDWAFYTAYDVFKDSLKRASPEPYANPLTLADSKLTNGTNPTTTYGFTSKSYTLSSAPEVLAGFIKYDNSAGGRIKFIVNLTGNIADDIVLLDTDGIDLLDAEYSIPVGKQGTSLTFKVEIITDGSGNGGEVELFGIIW